MRHADDTPRRLAIHAAIGALSGLGVAAAIAALDIAGLSSLASRVEQGWLALLMLAAGLTALFAALALGSGLFLIGSESEAPAPAQRAAPARAASVARTRSRWKV
jgi:hypothetical protein